MIGILVILCFGVAYTQVTEDTRNVTEIKQLFLNSYMEKICRSEKTCHLLDKVPPNLQTLAHRNCMCDSDCTIYDDCCEDSIYIYDKNNEHYLQPFHCSKTERVYMKTSCPPDYTSSTVISKCESSTRPLEHPNKKLFIPVTNIITNITYGNEYCAICNNDYQYHIWNLTAHCSELYSVSEKPENITTNTIHQENITEFPHTKSHPPSWRTDTNETHSVHQYTVDLEEAKKRIQFSPKNKTFFSQYNNKYFECWYKRNIPTEVLPHLRDCVPIIENCLIADETLTKLCKSYTSIVYSAPDVAYKNKDCAFCNHVTKNFTGCNDPDIIRIKGSSLFSTKDKSSGHKPPCNSANTKFCN